MVAKLKLCDEEADEALYWLELAVESGLVGPDQVSGLASETDEVLRMIVKAIQTLRSKSDVIREGVAAYGSEGHLARESLSDN